jgi:RNA polymerase sigma-70 factor (ECF subfamily)
MTRGSGLSAERGDPSDPQRAVPRETAREVVRASSGSSVSSVSVPGSDAGATAGQSSGKPTPAKESPGTTKSPASPPSTWIAAVLRQYEGPLTLYAARITRDVERARDVVQEAFLKLLKEDREAVEPHLAEWLYTVCRNKALDVRRKESRMTGLSEASTAFEASTDPGPDQRLERDESAAQALRHLAKLPDNQQEVIRLKFQHGLSYKEISGITQLSVSNVGFLIHTGMKALRRRMGVEGA